MSSKGDVKEKLMACLRELHLPTFRECFEELARRAVQEIDDPLIGRTLHPGPVIRLDGEQPEDVVRWTGPAVGAHTDFVLHTLLGLPLG